MDRAAFIEGARATVPGIPANIIFGMLIGATAVQIGISPVAITLMSIFTFAAVAELTAIELLQAEAALPVVLVTVLLINLRYVIFSASLAPKVRHLSLRWRALIAYPLFDINYALSEARFSEVDADEDHRGWYALGASLPFVVFFVGGTLAGALMGQVVGQGLRLEFSLPLIFIALLAPQIEGRTTALAAIGAGTVAVAGANLQFNLGLLLAIVCGVAVALLVEAAPSRGSQ